MPRNSDAEFFYDLFTVRQLAGLALLKFAIDHEKGIIRNLLLLAWSASVAKLNKTFLSAKGRAESRGGSSIFSIYRYKLAALSVELPIWETFHGRFLNVLSAKEEVLRLRDYRNKKTAGQLNLDSEKNFRVLAHDAATLDRILKPASVDYIFTDPPYGAFISYLDLSILWNHWLGFPVTDETRERETIVGGEQAHTEEHYKREPGAKHQNVLSPVETRPLVFHRVPALGYELLRHDSGNGGAMRRRTQGRHHADRRCHLVHAQKEKLGQRAGRRDDFDLLQAGQNPPTVKNFGTRPGGGPHKNSAGTF